MLMILAPKGPMERYLSSFSIQGLVFVPSLIENTITTQIQLTVGFISVVMLD